jgi:hypothetical protein
MMFRATRAMTAPEAQLTGFWTICFTTRQTRLVGRGIKATGGNHPAELLVNRA